MSDTLKFHPLADKFPPMEGGEFEELVADIKANGLNEPIVMHDDMILDGRNRYRACIEAGVELAYSPFTGSDPAAFVISANIRRRHLTAEQKRELIVKLIKATPEKSDRQIAEMVRADHKTVGAARAEQEARGEIPHVSTRVDTRGRQQPARKKAKRQTKRAYLRRWLHEQQSEAASEDDAGDDNQTIWRHGLMYRAESAIGNAAFEDWSEFTIDSDVIRVVEEAAAAWSRVAAYLNRLQAEHRPAAQDDGLDIPESLRRTA
jgi:ParB-like chromosome segregation protein Spo0J